MTAPRGGDWFTWAMASDPAGSEISLDQARDVVAARIAQIDQLLSGREALEAERRRLQDALDLLGATGPPAAGSPRRAKPTRARNASGKSRSRGTGHRDAVLEFVKDNPQSEAGPIVAHVGASRGVIYNLIGRLVEQGVLEREQSEGGRAKYRVAPGAEAG